MHACVCQLMCVGLSSLGPGWFAVNRQKKRKEGVAKMKRKQRGKRQKGFSVWKVLQESQTGNRRRKEGGGEEGFGCEGSGEGRRHWGVEGFSPGGTQPWLMPVVQSSSTLYCPASLITIRAWQRLTMRLKQYLCDCDAVIHTHTHTLGGSVIFPVTLLFWKCVTICQYWPNN